MRPFPLLLAVLVAGCTAAAPRSPSAAASSPAAPPVETGELPLASDAAADSLLTDVQSADSTIRVELRYATADNFTGAPLPGYEGNQAFLRRPAAEALGRVQRRLREDGVGLLVFDAYRPVRATLAMVSWTERTGRQDLVRNGYIASRSRHNLGLAIDLTLVDRASGAELAMGTPFDTFDTTAHTANATGEAARNRQRLRAAMEAEGFTNYPQEWWHYSYQLANPVRFDRVIR
jgi:D-alanyl-D-alanine dipeptidase